MIQRIDRYGVERWFDHQGRLHRDDGPAYIGNAGHVRYCHHGKLHRLDGPAVMWATDFVEYWVMGEIPLSILDILIIPEKIDHLFQFTEYLPDVRYRHRVYHAYRFDDRDELALAILRYS